MFSLWTNAMRRAMAPAMPLLACQEMFLEASAPWSPGRAALASMRLAARAAAPLGDPGFGIDWIHDDLDSHERIAVTQETVAETSFCRLTHFARPGAHVRPRLLLVAPYSGHYASLLRETVRELLPAHDVYITEWRSARDMPLSAGRFGLEEYVDHLIRFATEIGEGLHIMAVCQPAPLALVAAVRLTELGRPPASLILMGGPVDPRRSPTAVNQLASTKSQAFFESLIGSVGFGAKGAGRAVYPGVTQLASFMAMNPGRHAAAQFDYLAAEIAGTRSKAGRIDRFYRDYLAVLDLPAEFYLETVTRIFQDAEIARGVFRHAGRRVDFSKLAPMALMTIEGGRDDICGRGQTEAAHDLISAAPGVLRQRHLETEAGHYGLFSGGAWRRRIAPAIGSFIARLEEKSNG